MAIRFRTVHASYTSGDPHRAQRLLSHLLERTQPALAGFWAPEEKWHPRADVYETPDTVGVVAEVAGVSEDDIQVTLYEDLVLVEGTRHYAVPRQDGIVFHEAQIPYGPFSLEVLLPSRVLSEQARARLEQGLLHLTLPKPVLSDTATKSGRSGPDGAER